VQREIMHDPVISTDFVVRHFEHTSGPDLLDANHFSSIRGRVLPLCSDSEAADPKALCSLGSIGLTTAFGIALAIYGVLAMSGPLSPSVRNPCFTTFGMENTRAATI
jgi:hypothetical protein